jgi:PAS domain S-box-containing protein
VKLREQNEELRRRLEEAEETLRAIRSGSVDGFLVEDGQRVYTLEGADRPYRMLIERMQQGALTLDAGGSIIYANHGFADLIGVPPEKLIGTVLRDFIGTAEYPAYEDMLVSVISGVVRGEIHLLAADGKPVPVCLTLHDLSPDNDATTIGVLVTDMRESEERYRTLVEQVKDYAIFRTDTKGQPTTWNEGVKRVLGFEQDEFLDRDITPLIFTPKDVRNGIPQKELDEAEAKGSASGDRWMQRKDGTRFFAFGVTNALRDKKGRLLGFTKLMRDQTERKRLEDQLRQLAAELSDTNQRKDEFLAILAHELRNPLAPIQHSLQIIGLAGDDIGMIAQARQVAERQTQQLVRLVDDLLDVARITRSKIELRKQRVDLETIVQSAMETNRTLILTAGHELTVSLPSHKVWLNADPTRLAQVLANLLNNAVKYTRERGHIWLTAEQDGAEVVIRVRDTGIGIAASMLPRIFDMFTQVNNALDRSQGGLGIGLTLVRRLIEMHGGSVEAASEGLGHGSEFIVRLPIAPEWQDNHQTKVENVQYPTLPARRILVVDDNVDAAGSFAQLLQIMGHDTRLAHDGPTALEAVQSYRPHMILLDIGLPGMNGYEVARRLRAQTELQDMQLVAVTGWGQEEARRRAYESGFDHHLTKPIELTTLEKLLASLANKVEMQ